MQNICKYALHLSLLLMQNLGDVPRVNGQLAVARAFGDQSLQAHLSSEPSIRHVPVNSTIEFVILASDGLWKVGYLYSRNNDLFQAILALHIFQALSFLVCFHW